MRAQQVLLDRGKLGRDFSIIDLKTLVIQEEEFPVYLGCENVDRDHIGTAKVYQKEGQLYANIDLPSNKAYLKLYPSIAVSIDKRYDKSYNRGKIRVVVDALLIGIVLCDTPNLDPKIPIIGKKSIN